MTTVILSGANRGLGLELARQYAAGGGRVFAGARDPASADALHAAANDYAGRLSAHPLDVADAASVREFAASVGTAPVDILIANAAVFGGDRQHELGEIDFDEFEETFAINTSGALRLADAFVRNLKAARGKFIAITSGMGSIAEAGGGYYGYRASKAALNMVCRALANDLKGAGVVCIALSPGWVKTDMGGASAPQGVAPTVEAMRSRIDGCTLADSGKLLNWDGRELPW